MYVPIRTTFLTPNECLLTETVRRWCTQSSMRAEILDHEEWQKLPGASVEDIGNHVYRVTFVRQPSLPAKPREYSSQRIRIGRRLESIEVVGDQVDDDKVVVFVRV